MMVSFVLGLLIDTDSAAGQRQQQQEQQLTIQECSDGEEPDTWTPSSSMSILSPRSLFRVLYTRPMMNAANATDHATMAISVETPTNGKRGGGQRPSFSPRSVGRDSLRKHLSAPPSPRASLVVCGERWTTARQISQELSALHDGDETASASAIRKESIVPQLDLMASSAITAAVAAAASFSDASSDPDDSPDCPQRDTSVLFDQWFMLNASDTLKQEGEFFHLAFTPQEDRVGQNIMFNGDEHRSIRAASFAKLIEVLARPCAVSERQSLELRDVIFATFTSFTTEDELLNRLGSMFVQCASDSSSDDQITMAANIGDLLAYWPHFYWQQMSLDTRCRLVKFLRVAQSIPQQHGVDFLSKARLVVKRKVLDELHPEKCLSREHVLFPVAQKWEDRLEEIEKQRYENKGGYDSGAESTEGELDSDPEEAYEDQEPEDLEPQFPDGWTSTAPFVFAEWPAMELARQLSLIEEQLFRSIETRELLSGRYTARKMDLDAPNLARNIHHFNALSRYLVKTILDKENLHDRAAVLEHCIEVAEHLAALNNFNTIMAIFGAMHSNSIYRLRDTWDAISDDHRESYEMLEELFSARNKMRTLRDAIDSATEPPVVPYLGLFLSDLSTIDSTNHDFLAATSDERAAEGQLTLINVNKCRLMAKVMRAIQTFQEVCNYSQKYKSVEYLRWHLSEGITQGLPSDDELYDRSCAIESRRRK